MEKIRHANTQHKKVGRAVLKSGTTANECCQRQIGTLHDDKRASHQDDISVINVYVVNNRALSK